MGLQEAQGVAAQVANAIKATGGEPNRMIATITRFTDLINEQLAQVQGEIAESSAQSGDAGGAGGPGGGAGGGAGGGFGGSLRAGLQAANAILMSIQGQLKTALSHWVDQAKFAYQESIKALFVLAKGGG